MTCVATRVEWSRKQMRLSRRDVAELAGVSLDDVEEVELGDALAMPFGVVMAVALAAQVEPAEIVDGYRLTVRLKLGGRRRSA